MDGCWQRDYGGAAIDTASPIRDGVSTAESMLSALHETISRLEKRLETVLRPCPPAANVSSGTAPTPTGAPCSHVMGRLRILNEGFDAAIRRVGELEGRVEV